MKKWFIFFSLFIFSILGGFLGYLYYYRAEFISQELSKALHCRVSIKALDLSSQGITIKGLEVRIKQENSLVPLFSVKQVSIITTPTELIKLFFDLAPAHIWNIRLYEPLFYLAYPDAVLSSKGGRKFFVDQLEVVNDEPKTPIIIKNSKEPLLLQDICQMVLKLKKEH